MEEAYAKARTVTINHVRGEAGMAPSEGSGIRATVISLDHDDSGWTAITTTNAHTDKTYRVRYSLASKHTVVTEYTQSSESRVYDAEDEADPQANRSHGYTIAGSTGYQIGDGNIQNNIF